MLNLVLMLMLVHLFLVLADTLVMLAGLTFAHIINKRPFLVLLAEGTVFAQLLLRFQLLTFLCNYTKSKQEYC